MQDFIILIILFSTLFCLLMVVLSNFWHFWKTGVPFIGTPNQDIEFVATQFGIDSRDVFYDLGSGDGRIIFSIERLTAAKAKGFELITWAYWLALVKKFFLRSEAEFVNGNFFDSSWREATIIYCYLFPSLMSSVEAKLKNECQSGTLLISRDFSLPSLRPISESRGPSGHQFFIYRLSA